MNVLELCLSPGLGGLELYVFRSADSLSKNHKVTAVLLNASKLDKYFKEHSDIDRLYLTKSINPAPLFNAKKLAKIIDDKNIDIIHMHWGKDFALAAFAKAFSIKKPAIVYTRQMMITRAKNDIYHNFLYGQMNLMLTITKELESLAKSFIRRYANKITTLYYGVKQPDKFLDDRTIKHLRETHGLSQDAFVAGLIGRLEEGKGQHLLINAVSMAKSEGLRVQALIIGHEMDIGYRETLKKMAQSLNVNDEIIFLDFLKNPQEIMQICDCIVLASYMETFGLVLPEAMRAGVAVIGSDKGGVPEIIDHNSSGLLFKSRDATSLYEQIKLLYQNSDMKKLLATHGMKKADEKFNNENHFEALEAHFHRVTSQP